MSIKFSFATYVVTCKGVETSHIKESQPVILGVVIALKNRTDCWKFYEIHICLDEGLGSVLWAVSDYVCYSLNM